MVPVKGACAASLPRAWLRKVPAGWVRGVLILGLKPPSKHRVHTCAHTCTSHGDIHVDLACMHALEKEMATHSSVLAWRIPGTGEPDGLPSLGSHRVGHD